MDKYEYKLRLQQLKDFYDAGRFAEAAKIANTIDWKKVRDWSTLAMVINIYDEVGQLEDAKNVCIIAYNRKAGGKRLVYKLAELFIRVGELEEATEMYHEFVEMAPKDISRYALYYRLCIAKGASTEKLISILAEYKQYDRDDGCLYELACLYEKAGMIEKAMAECDEIILWFNEGEYYDAALKLKKKYGALTHNQRLMMERRDSLKENPANIKKQTVTIELPKGILNAEDIVKAVTGKLDTEAIAEATKASMDTAKTMVKVESAPVNRIKDEELKEVTSDTQESVSPPKRNTVRFSDEMLAKLEAAREAVRPKMVNETGYIGISESFGEVVKDEVSESPAEEEEVKEAPVPAGKDDTRIIGQLPGLSDTSAQEFNNTIKIPVPDYSLYDTVNIQKELAESIAPYIEGMDGEDIRNETEKSAESSEFSDSDKMHIGDIVNNEEGVFKVVEDTSRIIMPGINNGMKLVELNTTEIEALKLEEEVEKENAKVALADTKELPDVADSAEAFQVAASDEEADDRIELEGITGEDADESDNESEFESEPGPDVASERDSEPVKEEPHSETKEERDEREIRELEKAIAALEAAEDEPEDTKEYQTGGMNDAEAIFAEEELAVSEEDSEPVDKEEDKLSETQEIVAAIKESISRMELEEAFEEESAKEDAIEPEEHMETVVAKKPFATSEEYGRLYDRLFKECFHRYATLKGMKKQIYDALETIRNNKPDGTSRKGNIVITGNQSINKMELGIAFVKALNIIYPENKRKIAKTNAESLNRRGLAPALDKLMGSVLIIDNASYLSEERISELIRVMNDETGGMIVILIDTEIRMIKFLADNVKLSALFENIIEIRKYNVNELVEIAREYAVTRNCTIGDKVLLKLYLVIDKLNTGEDSADVEMAHKVIEEAINRAVERRSRGLFGIRRKPADGPIALKESDITTEIYNGETQEEQKDE